MTEPYYVDRDQTTDLEPMSGYYYADDQGEPHGPFWDIKECREAITEAERTK